MSEFPENAADYQFQFLFMIAPILIVIAPIFFGMISPILG
jgi:hypothetical protein